MIHRTWVVVQRFVNLRVPQRHSALMHNYRLLQGTYYGSSVPDLLERELSGGL